MDRWEISSSSPNVTRSAPVLEIPPIAPPDVPFPPNPVLVKAAHINQISGAARKVDPGNVNADLDVISNYISEYLASIKSRGKRPSPVKPDEYDWPGSGSLIKFKDVISGAADITKDWDAKTIARESLQGVGELHILATGFLVLARIMERFEKMKSNKAECLCLLERMTTLIQEVKQLRETDGLKVAMEAKIKEAIKLIIEVSLACCTQIGRPKYRRFFSTTVNKKELEGFQTRLTELHRKIQLEMELVLHKVVRRVPPCPRASEEFRRENREQIEKVTELLKWESEERASEERAVAVILYGLGGTGKTALGDAVYWSLYHEEVLPFRNHEEVLPSRNHEEVLKCKYSYVRLFDSITSVPDIPKLQTQVLEDLGSLQEIRRYEDGRKEIESILEKEKERVFIYIDNVLFPDKPEQGLDAIEHLLPMTTEKVKKLRLLITTRDKGAADEACKRLRIKRELYPIETLEDTKALQLVKEELKDGEEDLVNEQLNGRDAKLGWDWEELSNIVGDFALNSLEHRALVTKDEKSMTAKVNIVILAIGVQNKGERFKFTRASDFKEVLNLKRDKDLRGIKGIWSIDNIGPLKIRASKLDLMCGSLRVLALQNSTKVRGRCNRRFEKLFFFSAEQISDIPFDLSKVKNLRHLRYSPDDFHNLCQMPPNGKHWTIQLLGLSRLILDRFKKITRWVMQLLLQNNR